MFRQNAFHPLAIREIFLCQMSEDEVLSWMMPQLWEIEGVIKEPGQNFEVGLLRLSIPFQFFLQHIEQPAHIAMIANELLENSWRFVRHFIPFGQSKAAQKCYRAWLSALAPVRRIRRPALAGSPLRPVFFSQAHRRAPRDQ